MELTAADRRLSRLLKEPCEVEIVTDSEYLKNGITPGSPTGSATAGRPPTRSRCQNQDLWEELDEQVERHQT